MLHFLNMASFVNTPTCETGIADSIQQHFANSHNKITRYVHHMAKLNIKAIRNVFQIRREEKH
jgi:hypothetical protein